MENRSARRFRGVPASLAVPLLLLSLLISVGLAQILHRSITDAEQKATIALAKFIGPTYGGLLDQNLIGMGFTPPSTAAAWGDFPVVRRIETAYLAAEAFQKGGGADMLRGLTNAFAQKYESVNSEPALASFMSPPGTEKRNVGFGSIPADTIAWKPDLATERAITALSDYCEGGGVGGASGVLRDYLYLQSHQVYDILRSSGTTAEAIARGLSFVPENERKPRLVFLVAHIDQRYGKSARDERDLDPYRKTVTITANQEPSMKEPQPGKSQNRRRGSDYEAGPEKQPPNPEAGGGGVGGSGVSPESGIRPSPQSEGASPGARSRAGIDYERFVRSNYTGEGGGRVRSSGAGGLRGGSGGGGIRLSGGGGGVSFGSMVGIIEGFGGVVFGNTVTSAPGLVPREIIWVGPSKDEFAADPASEGRLIFRFATGPDKTYGPVNPEDAFAAYHMVYEEIDGIKPSEYGQGTGLVGVEQDLFQYGLTLSKVGKPESDDRFRVVIHPAIARLGLGDSAILSDVLPIGSSDNWGLQGRLKKGLNPGSAAKFEDAFEDIINWKLTDARLAIGSSGSRLTVTRAADSAHPRSEEYRGSVFLSMNGFRRAGLVDQKFSTAFDGLLPDILAVSPEYSRMNQFAAVLGVFRWAQKSGAKFRNAPPDVGGAESPAWVVVDGSGVKFLDYEKPSATQAAFHAEVDRRLQEALEKLPPEASALLRKEQESYDQAGKLTEVWSDTDTELARIQMEWRTLKKAVFRAITSASKDVAKDYNDVAPFGPEVKLDPADAKVFRGLLERYAPASVIEFERMRKQFNAANIPSAREERSKAIRALKTRDQIRAELASVMPEDSRIRYETARRDKENLEKQLRDVNSREDAALTKLQDLDREESERVKRLPPTIQKTYQELNHKVYGFNEEHPDAAKAKLDDFVKANFPDIQNSRKVSQTDFRKAIDQVVDLRKQIAAASDNTERIFREVYPGAEEWLELAPLCSQLIREAGGLEAPILW